MAGNECLDLGRITNHPGYRAILRTVLKTQIKQLVEQLSFYAGEEAILLSASITDGTLSHVGSKSGEIFLNTHGQVKSEFLGFCLKRHKKSKASQDETKEPSKQDKTKARIEKTVTVAESAKNPTSTESEKQQEKLAKEASNILEEHAYGTTIEKCPNITEDLCLKCENDSDCNSDTEMVANVNELINVTKKSDSVLGVQKEDNQEGFDTDVNDVEGNDTVSVNWEFFESMDMTCDNIATDIPGVHNKVSVDNSGETLVLVKEEPESDVSVDDASEDVARASNDSTSDADQASAIGIYKNGKLNWRTPDLIARYTRAKPGCVKKRKHNHNSIETKYQAIKEAEAGKKSKSQVARDFNIPPATLWTWLKSSQQIKDDYLRNDYHPERKRLQRSKHPNIDMVLLDWVRDAKIHEIQVSSNVILEKANEAARDLGYTEEEFTCTVRWVKRFKSRYGLTVKKK